MDDDRGPCRHDLTAVTHGWLRVHIRCWKPGCELRIPIGWRWQFRTVDHALAYYRAHLGW